MNLRTGAPRWFNEDNPEKEAKCVKFPATRDYDPWYWERTDPDEPDESIDAKKICNGTDDGRPCPLLSLCLEFAMVNNERHGIWGGMDSDERAKLRKDRRQSQHLKLAGVQN